MMNWTHGKPIAEMLRDDTYTGPEGLEEEEVQTLYLDTGGLDDSSSDDESEEDVVEGEEEIKIPDFQEMTVGQAMQALSLKEESPHPDSFDYIKLRKGERFVTRPSEEHEVIFVAGSTGCGKSMWIRAYIIEFMLMFPERRVILFSRHDEDPAYAELESVITIDMTSNNEELYETMVESLDESLVIFDDCDRIMDKDIAKFIKRLISDTIMNGRKMNINCIVTSHIVMDGAKTKEVVSQCNKLVIFPKGGMGNGLQRLFEVYLGQPQLLSRVMRTKGRWLVIDLHAPKYAISRKEAYLL